MCGILGIASYSSCLPLSKIEMIKDLTVNLLCESQIRGTDASGLCVLKTNDVVMYKDHVPATQLVKHPEFLEVINNINTSSDSGVFKCVIGHTRAQTKGDRRYNENNHPIPAGRIVGVHNGVIFNDDRLFEIHRSHMNRAGRVDSEIIFRLIDYYTKNNKNLITSVKYTHKVLEGSYSCAFIHLDFVNYLTLFRKMLQGLGVYVFDNINLVVFASSKYILDKAISNINIKYRSILSRPQILSLSKNVGIRINLEDGKMYPFELED